MKARQILTVAAALTVGMTQAETWYKIGKDSGSDRVSWSKSYSSSIGWASSADASQADTSHTVSKDHDYVITGGRSLRTASGAKATFAGKTLTLRSDSLADDARSDLILKNKSSGALTIEIPSLIIDGCGILIQGTDKTQYAVKAPTTILAGSTYQLYFMMSTTASGDRRDMTFEESITGDDTTVLDLRVDGHSSNTAHCALTGSSLEDFTGKIVSSTANSEGSQFYLYIQSEFKGTVESLPMSTKLIEIDYSKLPKDKGLVVSSTAIPAALKNALVFYGSTDFGTDKLPLVTFPAGTEVDPLEFTIRSRTNFIETPDGTESALGLKKLTNDDGTVTLVVDASVPAFAKIVKENETDWTWRFYDSKMEDLTETCGLTAPTKDIQVLFATLEEFAQLKATSFTSAGVLWTLKQLDADMDLTGCDFRIEDGATVDLNGHHLTLSGELMAATTDSTTLISTAEGAILEVNVPESEDCTISGVKIAGGANLQVWKTGLGSLMMSRAQEFGEGGKISFVVKEGRASKTNGTGYMLGVRYSKVVVEAGAQFDIRGRRSWDYDYIIAGHGPDGTGALVNNVSNSNPTSSGESGYLRHVELADDATIGCSEVWALSWYKNEAHNLKLNGHTLTLKGTQKTFWINLVPQDAGKVVVDGTVEVYGKNVNFSAVDVEVNGALDSNAGYYLTPVKSLVFAPNATWSGAGETATATVTVLEAYRPSTKPMPAVTLGAEGSATPVLDLSTQTTTLNGTGLSFYEGATVTVELGERDPKGEDKKLVSWTQKPADTVRFKLPAGASGASLAKKDDGLYLVRGMVIMIH